jgi:hypothetical protein
MGDAGPVMSQKIEGARVISSHAGDNLQFGGRCWLLVRSILD